MIMELVLVVVAVGLSISILYAPVVAVGVDINFQNQQDGYVLRPLYTKNATKHQFVHSQSFIVLSNQQDAHLLHAKFGPYEIYQTIPKKYVNIKYDQSNSPTRYTIINNMDVNVQILDHPNSQKKSRLRVLFHISPRKSQKSLSSSFGFFHPGRFWCAQIFVEYNLHQVSSQCLIKDGERACIASLFLPLEWWHSGTASMDVRYSVTQSDDTAKCTSVANVKIPQSQQAYLYNDMTTIYLANITVSNVTETFSELRDHSVVIKVPQNPLEPGSIFYVPIKLDAGSDLKMFIIRVRARCGIKILSAELIEGANWDIIFVDVNDRQRSAAITLNIRDVTKPATTKKSEEILRVKLEVEAGFTLSAKVCRIIWSVDRGYNMRSRSRYYLPESKMVSRFRINVQNPEKIIAVLSVSDVLNTAVLTGQRESHRLFVYLVSDDSRLRYINNRSMCYSSDNHAIKVSSDCSHVYVDGTETRGAYNISIIIKYGGYTAFATLNVWFPERRLDIQLSDNKLSQVKHWRIPTSKQLRGYSPSNYPSKTHPHCQTKYQESLLNVYTRFHIDLGSRLVYYADKKAYFRLTDLVRDRIRVADSHVAEIRAGVIYGKMPGRTEIQVLSPYGRVLGASELRVLRDRVSVDRITAVIVTGITMDIVPSSSIEGAMDAVVRLDDTLRDKNQDGLLSAEVQYSDKSVVPLKLMDPLSYKLDLIPVYRNILKITQHRVTGLSSTSGKLIKYTLRSSDVCRRKKVRALAGGTIQVNIRLTGDEKTAKKYVQNDAVVYNQNGYESKFESFLGQDILTVTLPNGDGADSKLVDLDTIKPRADAQQQVVLVNKTLTPLEIGMYSLLAVFCLAISVFMVHCGVFLYRNSRKRVPKESSPVAANDWVWLGRATLERNSIMDTRCSQALMPEEDFNGNRISQFSSQSFADVVSRRGLSSTSASSSNRNSQISTYQGHECSIRITANPFDDTSHSQMSTNSSYLTPSRRSFHFPDRDTLMSMSETDHEWDYEAMGMTYDQLVDYFGNLKESSA